MRILHCCLASIFVDRYGYQENVITKMHKLQGHDVMILASTETMDKAKGLVYVRPSKYLTEDGVLVVRIPYVHWLFGIFKRKLRIYEGVKKNVKEFKPDVIFMHDAQTFAVFPIVSYIKSHPEVRLYIDSHTDFINSANNWFSKNILHRYIYKFYVRHTIPYCRKFYGTLPARVKFYTDFYGTPKSKTEFLPMGIDDTNIDFLHREEIRKKIRKILNIDDDDFVIITGGKIDKRKNVHLLLEAISQIEIDNVKVIVFGTITENMQDELDELIRNDKRILYVGWIMAKEVYKYIFASDLACFLGTHSTLWEDAVGYGIPAIFKKWDGITHIDRNGNCILIDNPTTDSIIPVLKKVCTDKEFYGIMKKRALSKDVMEFFFYSKIASEAVLK